MRRLSRVFDAQVAMYGFFALVAMALPHWIRGDPIKGDSLSAILLTAVAFGVIGGLVAPPIRSVWHSFSAWRARRRAQATAGRPRVALPPR